VRIAPPWGASVRYHYWNFVPMAQITAPRLIRIAPPLAVGLYGRTTIATDLRAIGSSRIVYGPPLHHFSSVSIRIAPTPLHSVQMAMPRSNIVVRPGVPLSSRPYYAPVVRPAGYGYQRPGYQPMPSYPRPGYNQYPGYPRPSTVNPAPSYPRPAYQPPLGGYPQYGAPHPSTVNPAPAYSGYPRPAYQAPAYQPAPPPRPAYQAPAYQPPVYHAPSPAPSHSAPVFHSPSPAPSHSAPSFHSPAPRSSPPSPSSFGGGGGRHGVR
jgi:hypothetical protein